MGFESFDDICNTGLSLGLGLGCLVKQENFPRSDDHHRRKKMKKMFPSSRDDPFLTLGPSDDPYSKAHGNKLSIDLHRQVSSVSAVSSFSNSSVKKERDLGDEDDEGSHRKKLRLTKQQSTVLEDSFKEHTNLNPKLKKALADQLNLSPRQVEVWFQNRRARTKLKQTEVDFELLKKCCETLTEQNKRLQNELQELKSWKLAASYSMQLPAPATLAVCPSCERIADGSKDPPTPSTTMPTPFMIRQKSCFISPLSHPSAACS